jgi:signal transduction histidine kinase
VRRSEVRLSGVPHRLLVLTDVQRALRAEEREAWQRLVRVLGHEINNSLGPIRSIAETLRAALAKVPRAPDADEDLARGLEVIERRADALARFMASYARLARLPPPRLGKVDVAAWVRRAADLETRLPVEVSAGPPVELAADADQLDQLLINLVANAVEAARETGGGVRVGWTADAGAAQIFVEDDGPGLSDTANLFVPFFTTKPAGSGIGLVLARQIAEQHGGSLALENRAGARGARAIVTMPIAGTTARPAGDR